MKQSTFQLTVAIILFLLTASVLNMAFNCANAGDNHRVYGGIGWTHWSNVDAGQGYNDKYEDNGDHYGLNVEYQYHSVDQYAYISVGVGKTQVNTRYQSDWDCSDCSFPAEIRFGYKWRLF